LENIDRKARKHEKTSDAAIRVFDREATIPYLARVCKSQLRFALISSGLCQAWAALHGK
jgi:hypothetical protein